MAFWSVTDQELLDAQTGAMRNGLVSAEEAAAMTGSDWLVYCKKSIPPPPELEENLEKAAAKLRFSCDENAGNLWTERSEETHGQQLKRVRLGLYSGESSCTGYGIDSCQGCLTHL